MSGRRIASGDAFLLYLTILVVIGIAGAFALAYAAYFFVGLGTFVFTVLSLGMG